MHDRAEPDAPADDRVRHAAARRSGARSSVDRRSAQVLRRHEGAERDRPDGRAGRGRGRDRPVGLGQEHAAQLPQLPGALRAGRGAPGRRADRVRARARRAARSDVRARSQRDASEDRHRVPAVQPLSAHDSASERHRGSDPGERRTARGGLGARSGAAREGRYARQGGTPIPPNSPAVSSSGWPSPALWR